MSPNLFAEEAKKHLSRLFEANQTLISELERRLVTDVTQGKSLFVFGSGHSSIFTLELYHRAGGASFVVPIFVPELIPSVGPHRVRKAERDAQTVQGLLAKTGAKPGEMIWIASQSGINGVTVDLALQAKTLGMTTVAFTSRVHSSSVQSRHPSGQRLFEVCDHVMDLGGYVGDASIATPDGKTRVGPLSSLGMIFLGQSVISSACLRLEKQGVNCVYTSVNTPEGERRNVELEKTASVRDPLLRG